MPIKEVTGRGKYIEDNRTTVAPQFRPIRFRSNSASLPIEDCVTPEFLFGDAWGSSEGRILGTGDERLAVRALC
jgi:hypothetical protein